MANMTDYTIPDSVNPEALDKLATKLSNEVARLLKVVAGYEIDVKAKEKAYRKAQGKAAVLNKSAGQISIVKIIIEDEPEVKFAADALQSAEAIWIMGKAKLEAVDKQYQMAKKLIDLRVQELRVFRG
jgi:uncharacterized protein YbaA (DUF1428 family)